MSNEVDCQECVHADSLAPGTPFGRNKSDDLWCQEYGGLIPSPYHKHCCETFTARPRVDIGLLGRIENLEKRGVEYAERLERIWERIDKIVQVGGDHDRLNEELKKFNRATKPEPDPKDMTARDFVVEFDKVMVSSGLLDIHQCGVVLNRLATLRARVRE